MAPPRPPPQPFLTEPMRLQSRPSILDSVPERSAERIDWRDKGIVTPVRDQGDCFNCVSFAIAALIESHHKRQTGADVELAASWMHQCVAEADCDMVSDPETMILRLPGRGIPLASSAPYPWPKNQCVAPGAIVSPAFRDGLGDHDIMRALQTGPVMVGMRGDKYFWEWQSDAVYRPTILPLYDHAICLVGYDTPAKFWIAKNSYGHRSGKQGYVKIAYGSCSLNDFRAYYIQ